MEKIPRDQIKTGMRFSDPVFFDDGEYMFLPEKTAVKQRNVDILIHWDIPYVLTGGRLLRDDECTDTEIVSLDESIGELEELDEYDSAGTDKKESPDSVSVRELLSLSVSAQNRDLYRRYYELIEKLHAVFKDIRAEKTVSPSLIDDISVKTVDLVNEDMSDPARSVIVSFLLESEIEGMEFAKSSLNTAILTIIICIQLKAVRRRVVQMATGALLYDVGMFRIPSSIVEKKSKLTPEELNIIKTHPTAAYRIITGDLHYPGEIGNIALQHHERWDGTGYPGGRAGNEISAGARIVSIADAFEAMISQKTWRSAMIGYQAMKNLLSDNSRRFDPDILKIFIQCLGIYPIGSIVLLNNGIIARVTEEHSEAPLRPRLQVVMDGAGATWPGNEGPLLDLLADKTLFIARAIDPREFSAAR